MRRPWPRTRTPDDTRGSLRQIVNGLDIAVRDVVVVGGRGAAAISKRLDDLLPGATIHTLTGRGHRARAGALARLPQAQLIVDGTDAGKARKRARRRRLRPFLAVRGVYATGTRANGFDVIRQQKEQRFKIRDSDANELLTARYGSRWGRVVAVRPAVTYSSAATITLHGTRADWPAEKPEPRTHGRIEVPELSVREYADVTCWSHQRVAFENYWLPDTFRHHLHRELTHRALNRSGHTHAALPPDVAQPAGSVDGPHFYFDSEYPLHFGHFLTEVLARYWGWQEAVQVEPGLRPLVSLPRGREGLPAYQRQIYEALGVDISRVTYIPPNEAVRVSSLYAATPAFVMPHYASPELGEVWATLARAMTRQQQETPRRLFVGRRVRNIRSCLNTDEVESFFTELGFTVIYPEDHEFAEQVTMFANAEVIAGFAGSGLFNMMFAPDKTVIVICADTYTATNEYLIASVIGGRLHYFLAEAEIKHTRGKWTKAGYQSNFRFDVLRYAPDIRELVAETDS